MAKTGGIERAFSEFAGEEGTELGLAAVDIDTTGDAGDTSISDNTGQLQRKIIYNATLDVVVENFGQVVARVQELARDHNAIIAKSSIDTASGRPRSGSWTIRVPVAGYRDFLEAAGSLGELQRRTEDSREVTAEYYDLETRIRNKKLEEDRLLKHLEESTGKLEDILAVEKELSRVRTEIEQMEGQLRVLQDLTALSTVTLNISELDFFVPSESPSFVNQVRRAWTRSIDGIVMASRNFAIAVVAVVPWLIILSPLVILWLIRRRRRSRRH